MNTTAPPPGPPPNAPGPPDARPATHAAHQALDDLLRERWGRFTAASIARTANVHRATVYRRAAALGLVSSRSWRPEEDEQLQELLAAMGDVRRVAKEMGRSTGAVRRRAQRLRLRAEDWRTDLDVATIADLVGRHARTVTSWIERRELRARKTPAGWRVWPKVLREFLLTDPSRVRWHALGTDSWEVATLLGGRWGGSGE